MASYRFVLTNQSICRVLDEIIIKELKWFNYRLCNHSKKLLIPSVQYQTPTKNLPRHFDCPNDKRHLITPPQIKPWWHTIKEAAKKTDAPQTHQEFQINQERFLNPPRSPRSRHSTCISSHCIPCPHSKTYREKKYPAAGKRSAFKTRNKRKREEPHTLCYEFPIFFLKLPRRQLARYVNRYTSPLKHNSSKS